MSGDSYVLLRIRPNQCAIAASDDMTDNDDIGKMTIIFGVHCNHRLVYRYWCNSLTIFRSILHYPYSFFYNRIVGRNERNETGLIGFMVKWVGSQYGMGESIRNGL